MKKGGLMSTLVAAFVFLVSVVLFILLMNHGLPNVTCFSGRRNVTVDASSSQIGLLLLGIKVIIYPSCNMTITSAIIEAARLITAAIKLITAINLSIETNLEIVYEITTGGGSDKS